jgi:hypothetical protein
MLHSQLQHWSEFYNRRKYLCFRNAQRYLLSCKFLIQISRRYAWERIFRIADLFITDNIIKIPLPRPSGLPKQCLSNSKQRDVRYFKKCRCWPFQFHPWKRLQPIIFYWNILIFAGIVFAEISVLQQSANVKSALTRIDPKNVWQNLNSGFGS